jgi:hypothetical protein
MKQQLKDYIQVFDSNYFPKKKCNQIIKALDPKKSKLHTFYKPLDDTKFETGDDPESWYLKDGKIGDDTATHVKDVYFKIIFNYVSELNKDGMYWFIKWNGYSFPKFIKYTEGTGMVTHCDHIHDLFVEGKVPRGIPFLSLITALNEDYEGGELVLCEKFNYKLKTGQTIVFPSNFLYPHEIKKVTKGHRYSMVSWVY